ncbi:unnamed protein product [Rotaria magnacalcarata]|uniref:LicD/FKTN/FKRP nucleotidyltransferase domain-containing protein n=2 Tax=Rotaria magnacalcarata TaxID=392030 RepID=A0A816N6H3_9BILA|nr:unnamed protein product [Rotaria magnacalcarata]
MRYYQIFIAITIGFIFGIVLTFNNYQTFSYSRIMLAYTRNSIEKVLVQIPTCTPDDGARQSALLHTLLQWSQFAQEHNIRYWIAYKTLLGYVQRDGLLPNALDFDILAMAQDTSRLAELRTLNFSSDYELKVHPQWFIVEKTRRSYFDEEGIDFVGPNARFVNRKDHVHINIWPMYDYHPNQTRIEKNSKPMLTECDRNYKWKSSPKEWTFPLQKCLLSRINVWCPAEPEKIGVHLYGQSFLIKSPIECINGTWKQSHEDISTIEMTTMTHTQTTTTRLSDEEFIEKVLKSVPTCESDDRDRQRYLLHGLQAWSQLAEKYNIQYWISYGTLVGFTQRGGLLPHDLDTDIMILFNDTRKLVEVSKLNFSSTYEIKVQPQWEIAEETKRSYFRKDGINFVAPNARFIHLKTRYHVDIFPAYDFNPIHANKSTEMKQSENLTIYDINYNWLSYPRSWTYPLKTCYFSEIKLLCPAEPKQLVATIYGVSSLTKSDRKCANGSWVRNP